MTVHIGTTYNAKIGSVELPPTERVNFVDLLDLDMITTAAHNQQVTMWLRRRGPTTVKKVNDLFRLVNQLNQYSGYPIHIDGTGLWFDEGSDADRSYSDRITHQTYLLNAYGPWVLAEQNTQQFTVFNNMVISVNIGVPNLIPTSRGYLFENAYLIWNGWRNGIAFQELPASSSTSMYIVNNPGKTDSVGTQPNISRLSWAEEVPAIQEASFNPREVYTQGSGQSVGSPLVTTWWGLWGAEGGFSYEQTPIGQFAYPTEPLITLRGEMDGVDLNVYPRSSVEMDGQVWDIIDYYELRNRKFEINMSRYV